MTLDIQASFARLKNSARCDDDVLAWFRAHPTCLPNVSPLIAPFVQVDNYTNILMAADDGTTVFRHYQLYYRADLPKGGTIETFTAITGCKTKFLERDQQNPKLLGDLGLLQDAREWPYVLALTGKYMCRENRALHPKQDVIEGIANDLWPHVFPQLSLATLRTLAAAGLTPEDDEAFARFVVDYAPEQDVVTELPGALAP